MNVNNFPTAYLTLINSFSGTKYYLDAINGSDSNNGTSPSTPWKTYTHAEGQTNSISSAIMFVMDSGVYDHSVVQDTYASTILKDWGYERHWVCNPGNTVISGTALAQRDFPAFQLVSGSTVTGAIVRRNNNGKTTNYTVAFFRGFDYNNGTIRNCVIEEVGTNGNWSLQYDNNANANGAVNNCLFNVTEVGQNDYSGGAGFVVTNTAFTYTYGSGSATKTNPYVGATVNTTSGGFAYTLTANNDLSGVWSGTYAWEAPAYVEVKNTSNTLISNINEGSSVVFELNNSKVNNSTVPYTITGVSNTDINIALTGTITTNSTSGGSLTVGISADYPTTEGIETMTCTFGNSSVVSSQPSGSVNILDTSSILYNPTVSPQTGDLITIVLTTSGETNGTNVAYTIYGATEDQLSGYSNSGNVSITNNTANIVFGTGGIVQSNVIVSAYSANLEIYIDFNEDISIDKVTFNSVRESDKAVTTLSNTRNNFTAVSVGNTTVESTSPYVFGSGGAGATVAEKEFWM